MYPKFSNYKGRGGVMHGQVQTHHDLTRHWERIEIESRYCSKWTKFEDVQKVKC